MAQRYTIQAVIYPGDTSGYVAECLNLAIVTQGAAARRYRAESARSDSVASDRGRFERTGATNLPVEHGLELNQSEGFRKH